MRVLISNFSFNAQDEEEKKLYTGAIAPASRDFTHYITDETMRQLPTSVRFHFSPLCFNKIHNFFLFFSFSWITEPTNA